MRGTYVDTSCLVAIAFDEANATELAGLLGGFDELFSANLLEAELPQLVVVPHALVLIREGRVRERLPTPLLAVGLAFLQIRVLGLAQD